jgi:hypothetical protein
LDSLPTAPGEPNGEHDAAVITLRWTFERADFQDAIARQPAYRRLSRQLRWLLVGAVPACVLFALRPSWLVAAVLITMLLTALAIKTGPRLTASQQLRRNPQLQGQIEATVSATGVRVHIPGAATEYAWDVFWQVDETDRAFLLSLAPNAAGPFVLLPKRALSHADLPALRDLLHRSIPGSRTRSAT